MGGGEGGGGGGRGGPCRAWSFGCSGFWGFRGGGLSFRVLGVRVLGFRV